MRINLRKIDQLVREAYQRGQHAALRGHGKSACVTWSYQVARDFFPDIAPDDALRIAQGKARLYWDPDKREIVVVAQVVGFADIQRGERVLGRRVQLDPATRAAIAPPSSWDGLCPAGQHGLDFEGQPCDMCAMIEGST